MAGRKKNLVIRYETEYEIVNFIPNTHECINYICELLGITRIDLFRKIMLEKNEHEYWSMNRLENYYDENNSDLISPDLLNMCSLLPSYITKTEYLGYECFCLYQKITACIGLVLRGLPRYSKIFACNLKEDNLFDLVIIPYTTRNVDFQLAYVMKNISYGTLNQATGNYESMRILRRAFFQTNTMEEVSECSILNRFEAFKLPMKKWLLSINLSPKLFKIK